MRQGQANQLIPTDNASIRLAFSCLLAYTSARSFCVTCLAKNVAKSPLKLAAKRNRQNHYPTFNTFVKFDNHSAQRSALYWNGSEAHPQVKCTNFQPRWFWKTGAQISNMYFKLYHIIGHCASLVPTERSTLPILPNTQHFITIIEFCVFRNRWLLPFYFAISFSYNLLLGWLSIMFKSVDNCPMPLLYMFFKLQTNTFPLSCWSIAPFTFLIHLLSVRAAALPAFTRLPAQSRPIVPCLRRYSVIARSYVSPECWSRVAIITLFFSSFHLVIAPPRRLCRLPSYICTAMREEIIELIFVYIK